MKHIFRALILFVFTAMPAVAAEHVMKANDIYEECFDMQAGQGLSFSFSVNGKVGFNLHYHEDDSEESIYLIQQKKIKAMESAAIQISVDEQYCLMWVNDHWADKKLNYEFEIVPVYTEAE